MTVNIVYSATGDGDLNSIDANYTNARNGPADTSNTVGLSGFFGQEKSGSNYVQHQAFLSFNYAAITELVTAVYIETYSAIHYNTGIARDLEFRGAAWSTGGLTVSDWQSPTALNAARLDGVVRNVQNSVNQFILAGSDELLTTVPTVTNIEDVLVSNRERSGSTPTTDERSAVHLSDQSGTSLDPKLVWSSVPRSTLVPVLHASVQMAGGGNAELYGTGAAGGTITLRHYDTAGAAWTAALPADFDLTVRGAQGFTLVRDELDNLYVIGKAASGENSLAVQGYVKTVGAWTWTGQTVRTVALPSHDTAVNNVAAAYHATAGGTIMVTASHTAGIGESGVGSAELVYALLSAAYLRTGTGTLTRSSGSLIGGIQPAMPPQGFNGYANEVGTSLDVTPDHTQAAWGYVTSLHKGQEIGDSRSMFIGRYILNTAGDGFTHTSWQSDAGWAMKDAASKIRLVPVGDGQVAMVTADVDPGYGLTVEVFQAQGTSSGLTKLGGTWLSGSSTNMPDGPAVGAVNYWDVVYSSADNSLWLYFRHSSDNTKVMRSRFSLNTYQASGTEVTVLDSADTVIGIRAPRNAVVTSRARIQVATLAGSTHGMTQVVDTFNIAPTAPTLTPRANYDATAAATFAWTFTDPNLPDDSQSAYDMEVQRTDTNATVITTGKTTSGTSSRNVAGGTLTNGLSYRWRVRTWDAADVVGAWSDWGTFSTSAGGTVTITDPVTDNPATLITDETQISWSVAGTTQASYRVILTRNDTGATVSDSGWVASTDTSLLISGMVTGVEHTASVQVRNASLVVSGIGTRLLTPNYGVPEVPLVTVTPVPDEGYVLITIDNPLSGQPDLGTTIDTMESGIADWVPISCTAAHSTEQAYSGTRSLKLTVTGSPGQAYARKSSGAGLITVTERYTVRMWVYLPVARDVYASIDWADAFGSYISTSASVTSVPAAVWTEIQVTGTAPTNADRCSFGPTLSGSPATGTVIYTDDVVLLAASDRPEPDRNVVMRRPAGTDDPWTVVEEADVDGSVRDYGAPGGVPLEYVVRGVAD